MVKLSIIASSVLVKCNPSVLVKCNPCVYTIQSLNIATMLDRLGKQGT